MEKASEKTLEERIELLNEIAVELRERLQAYDFNTELPLINTTHRLDSALQAHSLTWFAYQIGHCAQSLPIESSRDRFLYDRLIEVVL